MFEELFQRQKLIPGKILAYGFEQKEGRYQYTTDILKGSFSLTILLDQNGLLDTSLMETETGEEYVLYKTNASGSFIGTIRMEIAGVLQEIADKCFEPSIFKMEQTLRIIDYVRKTYGDELEFLWKTSPGNAIWRRQDTKKWYAVILTLEKSKLGIPSKEITEIIDLRMNPELLKNTVDNKKYFPGWHMNKKHWFTIILDGSVPYEEICRRIDDSYLLADK